MDGGSGGGVWVGSSKSERDVRGGDGRGGGARGGRSRVDEGSEGGGSRERVDNNGREDDVELARGPDADEDSEGGDELLEAEKEKGKKGNGGKSADASFPTRFPQLERGNEQIVD